MKYIYGIIGIILFLSCVMWGVSSIDSGEAPGENALVINERSISFAELQQMWQQKPYHYRDQKEFLDDLVLREILIQEAIVAGIADEEQFKRLIQDFFEQSLVKTLLDRKQLEQHIELSTEILTRFRNARQLRYQLNIFRYPTYAAAQAKENPQTRVMTEDFVAMPESIQAQILNLQPDELSVPFADGSDYVRLQITAVESAQQLQITDDSEEELQQQLRYLLQQQRLEEWIQQLRQQAVVHYPQQRLNKGDD